MKIDPTIYFAHAAYWGAFGIARVALRSTGGKGAENPENNPLSKRERTAPFSRALVAFHMVAFAAMYSAIWLAVASGRIPHWVAGQRIIGSVIIVAAAGLAVWSLVYFRSWRFRAKLEEGHQLATGGPFRILRHPIYMSLNLLALGSAIWIPTALVWSGFALMIVGSDLRARAEEKLLDKVFGSVYRDYCMKTRRFLPGIY